MLGGDLNTISLLLRSEAEPVDEYMAGSIPSYHYSKDSSEALRWATTTFNKSQLRCFPIEEMLEALSVSVLYEVMADDGLSGYVEQRSGRWYIGINKYEVSGRQRFTLAHEFAHILFHRHIIAKEGRIEEAIKLFRSEENYNRIEMEANDFASNLLMPSDVFRREWEHGTLKSVSEAFCVSRYAAEYRARRLRLQSKEA